MKKIFVSTLLLTPFSTYPMQTVHILDSMEPDQAPLEAKRDFVAPLPVPPRNKSGYAYQNLKLVEQNIRGFFELIELNPPVAEIVDKANAIIDNYDKIVNSEIFRSNIKLRQILEKSRLHGRVSTCKQVAQFLVDLDNPAAPKAALLQFFDNTIIFLPVSNAWKESLCNKLLLLPRMKSYYK